MARCCVRTTEGLSHPSKVEAARGQRHLRHLRWPSQACQPALLGEAPPGCRHHTAALIPLSGPPHRSPGAAGTRSLRRALPDAYCLSAAALRLSPMEDPATSIVPADFPTAPGPRAPWPIVAVLAQPQGQRPGASRRGCGVPAPEAAALPWLPDTCESARQSGLRVSRAPAAECPTDSLGFRPMPVSVPR